MNDEPQEQIRRLVEAQEKLKDQSYGMIVLTSGPTPISINDALAILLEELRGEHGRMQGDLFGGGTFTGRDIEIHEGSYQSMGQLLRLDFGPGIREDNERLYDALATLRMVVG